LAVRSAGLLVVHSVVLTVVQRVVQRVVLTAA
jgi:hypothetical protein